MISQDGNMSAPKDNLNILCDHFPQDKPTQHGIKKPKSQSRSLTKPPPPPTKFHDLAPLLHMHFSNGLESHCAHPESTHLLEISPPDKI